jgi:hypothetical protein
MTLATSPQLVSKWTIALAALAGFMLLAMIFYPFGYDQAVFSVGGDMILKKSALPWHDFLDTKPPLIFYLYSLALFVFGHHEWSSRAFDILYQFVASIYFYRILRREFDANFSLLTVSLTMILYAGSGFWMTAQAESFALLPSLITVDATIRYTRGKSGFALGAIVGLTAVLLLLLKLTLVLGAVAASFYVIFDEQNSTKRKASFLIGSFASSVLLIAVLAHMLDHNHVLGPMLLALQWLTGYSSIRDSVFLFPERLVYSTSIALFIAGAWGLWKYYRQEAKLSLPSLLAFTFVAQLIGILIEGKIVFPYQYARALWAFAPFMVLGSYHLIESARSKLSNTILVFVLLIATIFSPLPRLYTQSISWILIQLRGADAHAEVQRRIKDYFAEEQVSVANCLKTKGSGKDDLFFWGNDVGIYFFASKIPTTICLTATPLRTSWTPHVWRDTMMSQLQRSKPKYFLTEFGDAKEYITGSPLDSYKALLIWPELQRYLYNNYTPDTTIGHFEIFRRRR